MTLTPFPNGFGYNQTILEAAAKFLPLLRSLNKDVETEGHGGYFCLGTTDGIPSSFYGMGDFDPAKTLEFTQYAGRKTMCLGQNPEALSSAQLRDPDNGLYGGGVRVRDMTISFSGLPEQLDEVLCLLVAVECNQLTLAQAQEIAELWDNELFQPALELCQP